MPIPGYQDFMLPLLKLASDGQEHSLSEAMETLAHQLGVTDPDQELFLPSGTQIRYYNRVSWAVSYLTKSLLLEKVSRGRFKISARGIAVLKQNPPRIDNVFLAQFPEYQEFKVQKGESRIRTTNPAKCGRRRPISLAICLSGLSWSSRLTMRACCGGNLNVSTTCRQSNGVRKAGMESSLAVE